MKDTEWYFYCLDIEPEDLCLLYLFLVNLPFTRVYYAPNIHTLNIGELAVLLRFFVIKVTDYQGPTALPCSVSISTLDTCIPIINPHWSRNCL